MDRLLMKELNEIVTLDVDTDNVVVGYTTRTEKDINNDIFEILDEEVIYYRVTDILNNALYVSQEKLFEVLTQGAGHDFYTEDIYSHGYPEAGLVPSDHAEESEKAFIEMHLKMFEDKLSSIIPYREGF